MNLKEYQKRAMKTAIYPRPTKPALYPFLGLANKAGEVCGKVINYGDDGTDENEAIRKRLIDEIGDCCWYLSACLTEMGCVMEERCEYIDAEECDGLRDVLFLSEETGKVLGILKKSMRDENWDFGKEMSVTLHNKVYRQLGCVLGAIMRCCVSLGVTLDEVLDLNIAKLKSRQERGKLHGSGDNR
jgi:hypothetical protein